MPKVSIVLPTYNGERYLRQSVDSILAQTYKDWELIIVDDCSTDKTAEIVDMYCESDSRIRIIHNTHNQKLPQSLNNGFAVAKGQYLTWTSDDNLYLQDALAVMARYLDEHKDVYMVRGAMESIDKSGDIIGQSEPYSNEKMYEVNCLGACFLYRREVREKVGDYAVDMFCVEDYDYWLRTLAYFGEIVPIDKILYQYRRHESSLSMMKREEVRNQLTKLRICHLDRIFEALCDKKDVLCRIYYEMKQSENMMEEVTEKFMQKLPELRGEVPVADKKYIIFGAGNYGEKAVAVLGNRAAFFADNNPVKVGTIKCGLKIMAFQEAIRLAGNYCFLIAVSEEKIYEMILQLQGAGIWKYCVFTEQMHE